MKAATHSVTKFLICLMLILIWITASNPAFSREPPQPPPAKITALYLYNFLLFVDWPDNAFSGSDTLKVCVFNAPAFYEALKPMEGKEIKGKNLAIFSLATPAELDESCWVLFVGGKGTPALNELLEKVKGRPTLTVSENPAFASSGGMVVFKGPGDLLGGDWKPKRFIINLSAVRNSGLKIRSRLLRMSDVVYDLTPETLNVP